MVEVPEDARFAHQEPAVDVIIPRVAFLVESNDARTVERQEPEPGRRMDSGHSDQSASIAMELKERVQIDVGEAVSVGEHERAAYIGGNPLHTRPGHRLDSRIDKRDIPRFSALGAENRRFFATGEIECEGARKDLVIEEVLLNELTFVAEAQDEAGEAK